MKICIATDHNGVNIKQTIIDYLTNKGYEVLDLSPENTPTDDYPIYAKRVGDAVTGGQCEGGILLCGTGIGMSIAANKLKGIRCAKVSTPDEAWFARNDNHANVISLSFKYDIELIEECIDKFFTTPWGTDERHVRRVNLIKDSEQSW